MCTHAVDKPVHTYVCEVAFEWYRNRQVAKCVVMAFLSTKITIVSLILTGYGFVLLCMLFVLLALLDHLIPDEGSNTSVNLVRCSITQCKSQINIWFVNQMKLKICFKVHILNEI